MEYGVKEIVVKLCECVLDRAFQVEWEGDALLSSLQPPCRKAGWEVGKTEIRALVHIAYDLLLLRKWAWFGSWGRHTPLSPLCWCLAYSYGYHVRGREREGERLRSALTAFSTSSEHHTLISPSSPPHQYTGRGGPTDGEAVLQFLALLAGDLSPQPPLTAAQVTA